MNSPKEPEQLIAVWNSDYDCWKLLDRNSVDRGASRTAVVTYNSGPAIAHIYNVAEDKPWQLAKIKELYAL